MKPLHFAAMLIDYHMHTKLTDGVGVPFDYAKVALERGLDEIGCAEIGRASCRERV